MITEMTLSSFGMIKRRRKIPDKAADAMVPCGSARNLRHLIGG